MAAIPPPQGISESDYETIEAAVTETVRGRWFLNEFSRRNRLAETRQLLEAMARLEAAVSGGQAALPSADPSIRLLIQRIKEIASQLGTVAGDMRAAGVDERYIEAVDSQARAVSGMMRSATTGRSLPKEQTTRAQIEPARPAPTEEPPQSRGRELAPLTETKAVTRTTTNPIAAEARPPRTNPSGDPRLAALSRLDWMSLSEKLSLFT